MLNNSEMKNDMLKGKRISDESRGCAIDRSPFAVYCIDKTNTITRWSKSAERIFGWETSEIVGKSVPLIFDTEGKEVIHVCDLINQSGQINGQIFKLKTRNCEIFDTILWAYPRFGENNEIIDVEVFVTGTASRIYIDLLQARTIVERVVENTDICIFAHDLKNNISIFGTKGGEKIYGYKNVEFEHDPFLWRKVIHPDDLPLALVSFTSSAPTPIRTEYRIIRKDGEIRWISNYLYPTFDENGIPVNLEGLTIDVTQQKNNYLGLQRLAYTDQLTGIPNNQSFNKDIKCVMRDAKTTGNKFTILCIDLDDFKYINDTYGRETGDEVLRNFATQFNIRFPNRVKLYRMGGDEFIIVSTELKDKQQVVRFGNEFLHYVKGLVNDKQIVIRCSIGAAIYLESGDTVDALLKSADIAMNAAKERGGQQCCVYSEELDGAYTDRIKLHDPLLKAIQNEEFELYYQPKLCTKTGKLIGAEALIRWNRPGIGMVTPGSFIPYAEQSKLIIDIGKWALKQACQDNQKWQLQGLQPIRVSVNVSVVQLEHPHFVEQVEEILCETKLDPKWLEIEITESVLGKNMDLIKIVLEKLSSLGIQLAIDDFGTGYSSLQYLPYMQFDVIKIDQSFIHDLVSNKKVQSVVHTIIEMTKQLNMRGVAEGVEHKEQWEFLKQCDCDEIQGYLISKPRNHDSFEQYYKGITNYPKTNTIQMTAAAKLPSIHNELGMIKDILTNPKDIIDKNQAEYKSNESRASFKHLLDSMPVPVIIYGYEIIKYINQAGLKILDSHSLSEILGRAALDFVHPNDRKTKAQYLEWLRQGKESKYQTIEQKLVRLDGSIFYAEVTATIITFEGEPAVQLLLRDITKQKNTEEELKGNERRYRLLADNSLDLIQQVNLDGIVTYASPSHKAILGYGPEEYVGESIFYRPDTGEIDEGFQNAFCNMVLTYVPFTLEIVRKHKFGQEVHVQLKGTPVFNEEGSFQHLMIIGRDITERKNHEKKLEYLSFHDALTGLPNRRLFSERLEQVMKQAKRYERKMAIMFMDIDNFKHINDTFGHDVGDILLQQFANRVLGCLRDCDTLSRNGGDEFIVILPEIAEVEGAEQVALRILDSFKKALEVTKYTIEVTLSLGVAVYPKDGLTERDLLKHADEALYNAKKSGKNTVKTYSSNE